ncbi:MAG: hypothetical protein ABGX26_05445 [Nautiliaceae bacterium]|jgi:type II secretory pathway pseudopilin PulG
MSKSFTLIELIFVLVIGIILMISGLEFLPDETFTSDKQMLEMKIMQKKSNALGYYYTGENNYSCLEINKTWLNEEDNISDKIHYTFKSDISVVSGLKNGNTICFDYLGRMYDGYVDEKLTNLVDTIIILNLKYKKHDENITLYPLTGEIR